MCCDMNGRDVMTTPLLFICGGGTDLGSLFFLLPFLAFCLRVGGITVVIIASINIDKGFMYNPCSHSLDSCLLVP